MKLPGSCYVVLVQPEKALNIGAVARAMNNMGFSDLRLVGPVPKKLDAAYRMATNSTEILDSAKRFSSLGEALADASETFAVTRRGDLGGEAILTPRGLAELIAGGAVSGRCALVFGPEHRGLSNAETGLCKRIVTIPSNGECPSLNLSHAVMVVCHEIHYASFKRPQVPARAAAPAPASSEVEGFIEHARRTLFAVGFLKEQNPARLDPVIRSILSRAAVTSRELRVLRGMLGQIDWAVNWGKKNT